jgi:hypothetical protein
MKFADTYVKCEDLEPPAYHAELPIGGIDGSIQVGFRARKMYENGVVVSDPLAQQKLKRLVSCAPPPPPADDAMAVWLLRTRVWSAASGQIVAGTDERVTITDPIEVRYTYKLENDAPQTGSTTLVRSGSTWNATSGQDFRRRQGSADLWEVDLPPNSTSRLLELVVGSKTYPLGTALGEGKGCSAFQFCHYHLTNANDPLLPPPVAQCPVLVPPCLPRTPRPDYPLPAQ